MERLLVTVGLFALSLQAFAFSFHVKPFLQKPSPDRVIIRFERKASIHQIFKIQNIETGYTKMSVPKVVSNHPSKKGTRLYTVLVQNLTPATGYRYWLEDRKEKSQEYNFKTLQEDPKGFAYLVMSDAQRGHKTTTKALRNSVMKYAFQEYREEKEYPMSFTLFAGDLVQNGSSYSRWKKEFFDPMSPMLSKIGMYPALGNHEEDDQLYFSYFDLPTNGTKGFQEHWYYFDYGNVRFITLDTNSDYRNQYQLTWLEKVLEDASKNSKIDFVAAQFHHPHKSELWNRGETAYSGQIERRLVNFSHNTGKPSLYYCGHTHGYSRGHHPEVNHTMLVVGSIGGPVDDWGDYKQKDYLNYMKSLDEFGWMMVQVQAGENPRMIFKRFSFGDDGNPKDQGINDEFELRRYNKAPIKPDLTGQQVQYDGKNERLIIQSSEFFDADGDSHLSTLVEVREQANETLVARHLQHKENIYFDHDRNAEKSLIKPEIKVKLNGKKKYAYRIRYRDSALGWSAFSAWKEFR